MSTKSKSFFALATGLTAGALLGLLFAPDKGEETRKRFGAKLEEWKKAFAEDLDEAEEAAEDAVAEAEEAAAEAVEEAAAEEPEEKPAE